MNFRYSELFSGPGGLSLAAVNSKVRRNGETYSISHQWSTDYDKDSCETYKANIENEVIQPERGKGGTNYIRGTNIRGIGSLVMIPQIIRDAYVDIALNHHQTYKRAPRKVSIQNIGPAILLASGSKYGAGNLDDGLVYVGTIYCLNHDEPRCGECPVQQYCEGYNERPDLIHEYRT